METFDNAGAPDQALGITPGGDRSVPIPSGVTATPAGPANYSAAGAPDQRGGTVGAIPAGFALPPDNGGFEAALAETRRVLAAASDVVAERGPDPALARFRGSVRPAVEGTVEMWAERSKSHYAESTRSRYKPEALVEMDRAFETRKRGAMDDLRDRLQGELGNLESANSRGGSMMMPREYDDAALRLAAELSHLSPATGLGRLGEFLNEAVEEPDLAAVGRRFLKEIFQRPGTPWTRNENLYRVILMLDGICEASAALAGVGTTDFNATRSELAMFFDALADPVAGRFALGMKSSGQGRTGDAPHFFPDEQVAPARTSEYGDVADWRPYGGKIPRGRGGAVPDES